MKQKDKDYQIGVYNIYECIADVLKSSSIQFYYSYLTSQQLMQKYQILSAIGQGAYGVVLKCRDIESKSFVAIKKFKETDEQAHTKKTTIRQVKLLKMAVHPNIVELKEAFRKKGIVYLVFQYLENNLLQVLQKSPNGLPLSTIKTLIFQLLKGLVYLHEQNIVHRDIKPENLLVSRDQKLKICDFGFARQIRHQKDQGLTDYVATRWYRPPELLVGGEYGKQIDLWAVACIMCELIEGNPLFPGQNELDQLFLIQKSLGPLTADLKQRFLKNERFLGMKFPQIQNLDKIEKKYFGKICAKGLSLIKGLLKMDPKERMTASQALNHPFFQQERINQSQFNMTERKDAQTAVTNRKKETYTSIGINDHTKYGKIYNKRGKGYEAVRQVYQSSNNYNIGVLNSKSVGKPQKKQNFNQQLSLEKHRNLHLLTKTQARGFYFESAQQKLSNYGDISKKSTQICSVLSNQQLPFLIYSQQTSGEDSFFKNQKASQICKEANQGKKKINILQRQTFNIKQLVSRK